MVDPLQHLREVTTGDVTALAQSLHGHPRRHALGALRSLMRHCKKTGSIFADPTTRIRIGHRDDPVLHAADPRQHRRHRAAATTPAARFALVLAAVHAARPEAIRDLQLDDVDLGNRRLTIAGLTRPLDELTHRLLTEWLTYRRRRWPHTANPHLIINKQTASNTSPISDNALTAPFRRRAATLETLRMDRQLDEALTHGADPLHLAAVFGLDETTAIRYSTAARKLLLTPAEQQTPKLTTNPRTQAPKQPRTPLSSRRRPFSSAELRAKPARPLRTVLATRRGTRLKQPARAVRSAAVCCSVPLRFAVWVAAGAVGVYEAVFRPAGAVCR